MTRAHSNPRLPPSAALFDRPPPHFSTGAYSWLLEASKSGELKRGLEEALRDTLSLRKKIAAERLLAEKQLSKLQQQQERLKGKVVELALADKDSAAAALNDKLAALKQEIALTEARIEGNAAALRSLVQRVDVRADGITVWVYALPNAAVCQLEPEVVPTGVIRIPGENRRVRQGPA